MIDRYQSGWLGRSRRAVVLGLLSVVFGLVAVGGGAAPAGASGHLDGRGWSSAQSGGALRAQFGERITDYDFKAELTKDGTAKVTETIDYDFGTASRHGLERFIQVRTSLNADDPILDGRDSSGRWERVTPLTNLSASSPTGAPSDVEVIHEDSIERIRVGDPDKTVSGPQTYVLRYELKGVVNAFDGYEEVTLNLVGDQWRVPIDAATATR